MVPAAELELCMSLLPGYLVNIYVLAINLCYYKPQACVSSKEHGAKSLGAGTGFCSIIESMDWWQLFCLLLLLLARKRLTARRDLHAI